MRASPRVAPAVLTAILAAGALYGCSTGSPSRSTRPARTSSTGTTAPAPSRPPGATEDAPALDRVHITLTRIATVSSPTAMAVRRGDGALYVAEQGGRVRAFRAGALDPRPVLDVTPQVSSGGERGLLGLTFSPDGSHLYVDYTDTQGDTRVDEYAMRSDGTADRGSRRQLLAIAQPQANHNGGEVAFGPDGMLWVGMGDGGSEDDQGGGHEPGGNGQALDTLLGKLLRIDPRPSGRRPYSIPRDNPFVGGGGRPEIWAYGLRNPWRFTWDRATRALWIADVGQDHYEEVDVAPEGGRGANYGWNVFEGRHRFRPGEAPGAVDPVFEYSHDHGRCSITGGYVYRGTRIAHLRGAYLFSDYCDGHIRALVHDGKQVTQTADLHAAAGEVSSFGEDGTGELYVLSLDRGVFRVDP